MPRTRLFVLGVTNGTLCYLATIATYGTGVYQEQQSPHPAYPRKARIIAW